MISDPQSPPIIQQNANQQPFQTASLPQEIADAQAGGMLQRSVPPWMQRQALPPAQPPMYRPQFDPRSMGQGGWGGPPQMPQWAPPWMQQGGWGGGGGYGSPFGGGGYGGGGAPFAGPYGPGGYGGQSFAGPYGPNGYGQRQMPQYAPQQQQQYRAPNGNTGIAGPMLQAQPAYQAPNGNTGFAGPSAPQYNNQAVRPQPAGTVNQAAPAQAPAPQNRAAITPTPIYNRGNEMA